jgi:stage II sporulation protein R
MEVIPYGRCFFMKLLLKIVGAALVSCLLIWCAFVLADRVALNENLIRLHVVANSDSEEDQALKLKVRDAVVEKLQETMERFPTMEEARAYLQAHLPELEKFVNQVIQELGFTDTAQVSLDGEAFDTREYETFTLPAGYYEALRITIGEGQGQNWWCVVFPSLCVGTEEDFADTAAGAGFSDTLTQTLQDEPEIRFFLLDWLGQIENFFRSL